MLILIAAGREDIRGEVRRMVEQMPGDHRVRECSSAEEALQAAREERPQVVLVDVDLQPAGGFTLVQRIVSSVSGVSAILIGPTPSLDDFRLALRSGARDFIPFPARREELQKAVDLAARVSEEKRSALQEITALDERSEQPSGQGIVVFSSKGGTGKTFVAVNLAAGLARSGKQVALVDLDLQFGDAAIALGLVPTRTCYDLVQAYSDFDLGLMKDFMLRHSSGLQLLPAPLYPDQAEQITAQDIETMLEVVKRGYDYVIVDTPPFFEERVLTALDWADQVFLIASMDLPTIKNLKVSFTMMNLLSYPEDKMKLIVNRADSRVGLDIDEVEKHLGIKVRHTISSSIEVPRALNAGEAILLSKPKTRVAQELQGIVREFEGGAVTEKRPSRLLGRR